MPTQYSSFSSQINDNQNLFAISFIYPNTPVYANHSNYLIPQYVLTSTSSTAAETFSYFQDPSQIKFWETIDNNSFGFINNFQPVREISV